MTQVRDYVVQLEAHLAEVHRQSQRLIERQSKLGSSMSDFGASMVALGRFESGTLAQKFTKLGERADTLSGACQVSHTPLPNPMLSSRVVMTQACPFHFDLDLRGLDMLVRTSANVGVGPELVALYCRSSQSSLPAALRRP